MYLVQFFHYQRMPENAFPPKTKIQDPRFAQKSCGKSWIWEHPAQNQDPRSKTLARSLVGILDLGSWYFQDFSQESCGNLGSWFFQDFSQESRGNLGSWILVFPRFLPGVLWESWILDLGFDQECILDALNAF